MVAAIGAWANSSGSALQRVDGEGRQVGPHPDGDPSGRRLARRPRRRGVVYPSSAIRAVSAWRAHRLGVGRRRPAAQLGVGDDAAGVERGDRPVRAERQPGAGLAQVPAPEGAVGALRPQPLGPVVALVGAGVEGAVAWAACSP